MCYHLYLLQTFSEKVNGFGVGTGFFKLNVCHFIEKFFGKSFSTIFVSSEKSLVESGAGY